MVNLHYSFQGQRGIQIQVSITPTLNMIVAHWRRCKNSKSVHFSKFLPTKQYDIIPIVVYALGVPQKSPLQTASIYSIGFLGVFQWGMIHENHDSWESALRANFSQWCIGVSRSLPQFACPLAWQFCLKVPGELTQVSAVVWYLAYFLLTFSF